MASHWPARAHAAVGAADGGGDAVGGGDGRGVVVGGSDTRGMSVGVAVVGMAVVGAADGAAVVGVGDGAADGSKTGALLGIWPQQKHRRVCVGSGVWSTVAADASEASLATQVASPDESTAAESAYGACASADVVASASEQAMPRPEKSATTSAMLSTSPRRESESVDDATVSAAAQVAAHVASGSDATQTPSPQAWEGAREGAEVALRFWLTPDDHKRFRGKSSDDVADAIVGVGRDRVQRHFNMHRTAVAGSEKPLGDSRVQK